MRRGRPRHNDILTPREWEVLALLREGRTNEEIAARLGISINGAKFHVSEIITKLGVRSRGEAAALDLSPRRGFAGLAALSLRLATSKLLAGTAIVAALLLLVLLAVGVLVSRERQTDTHSTLVPTPTATPEGTPPVPTLTAAEARLASLFATANAVALLPTFTPTPVYAPVGEPIPVWVYSDSEPAENCDDLQAAMIPSTAPPGVDGKAVLCTLDPMTSRAALTQKPDGNYHLDWIMLLLLLESDWAPLTSPGLHDCLDVQDHILFATSPAADAEFVGVCAYVPPYRGEPGRDGRLAWTRVRDAMAPAVLPEDVLCEQTSLYLGPPGEASDLRDVTCLLR